jgi:hypothetical protein
MAEAGLSTTRPETSPEWKKAAEHWTEHTSAQDEVPDLCPRWLDLRRQSPARHSQICSLAMECLEASQHRQVYPPIRSVSQGPGSEGTRRASWEPAPGDNSTWEGRNSSLAQGYSADRHICSANLEPGLGCSSQQLQDSGAEEAA